MKLVKTDADGSWEYRFDKELEDGEHEVYVGVTDNAGKIIAKSEPFVFIKEAQALMMPMIMIQIVPLAMMVFVVMDPNNTLVRALSWFPLFTPYLMMNRAAADPPMVDLVGTTIVLVASILFVLWASGKVFKLGVLRTGQPPKVLELVRLLRTRH